MPTESGIEVLVRFARLASQAGTGAAALPLLADALVEHVGADGVAIAEIRESGPHFVPSAHMPPELEGMEIDVDDLGDAHCKRLLETCRGRFAQVLCRPLVSGGGLFGSVGMFFVKAPAPDRLALAEGLIDLGALALEASAKVHQLADSHARLRQTQETLARTEKLRALGQMAAGVSHDLKNILNPLSLHLQLIDRSIDKKRLEDAKNSVHEMKQVLTRGLQTIERLRDYSRQSPESRAELVDLDALVHEAAEIAKPRMASKGGRLNAIREELGKPKKVFGRSGDIVSAVVNLVVNAIDAMAEGGGAITLRTGSSEEGSWLEVEDTGPGMPPEIQERVFEPFFTTKGEEGTGLGLAMVFACMQRHGGHVKLESEVGKGTTFRLSFPPAPGA